MYLFDYDLADRYIISEMMIRTIERDRKHIDNLKMKDVMDKFFDMHLRKVKTQQIAIKNEMAKLPMTLQSEKKIDDLFSEYNFMQQGRLESKRYSNIALRNRTLKALEELFEIK